MAIDTSYYYDPKVASQKALGKSGNGETKGKQDLDMNDFIMLMVEQMKNQDMNNTQDTSEYINQLSQFTMIETLTTIQNDLTSGLQSIKELAMSSYSMSMIGKEATVALDSGDEIKTIQGTIEGVTYYNGDPMVIIEGEQYKLSQVMSVADKNSSNSENIARAAAEAAQAASEAARAATEMLDAIENSQDEQEVQASDQQI